MIAVVIPVHNRKEFTRECLKSLCFQTLPAQAVIIIDAGSDDGTAEMVQGEFPEAILLYCTRDHYWTSTINIGIRYALALGADYIITLNNDTEASPDFIEKMMDGSRQRPDSLIGALDVDSASGKPYYGGEIINWIWDQSIYLLDTLPKEKQIGLHEVSLFPARGLLVPNHIFKTVGLFDEEKLPHYMADYDFTLKARRLGFGVYCNYDALLLTHPEEGGDHKIRKHKTLRAYWKHLFDIKGGGNLRNFIVYAFRNCPNQVLPGCLVSGIVRRVGGFWLK